MTTKRRISKETRVRILARDNYRCVYCGRNSGDTDVKLTIDHIIPISRGGTDGTDNLWTLCLECNQGKSDMILRKPTREILSAGIPIPLEYSRDQVNQALQYYKRSTKQDFLSIYQAIIVVQTSELDGFNIDYYPHPRFSSFVISDENDISSRVNFGEVGTVTSQRVSPETVIPALVQNGDLGEFIKPKGRFSGAGVRNPHRDLSQGQQMGVY